jgi:hypothetical protein
MNLAGRSKPVPPTPGHFRFTPDKHLYDPTEVCPHTCIFVSAPNTLTTMFAATILAPQTPP